MALKMNRHLSRSLGILETAGLQLKLLMKAKSEVVGLIQGERQDVSGQTV